MAIKSSYTGTTKLKRFDGQYGTSYYAQMSKKNKDGKWQNAGKKIKFKKDVEFNGGDEIEIISAFETFNMNPQTKKPSFYIFCMEFKKLDNIQKTRRLLKQFLYALHKSEGFGSDRLMRVIAEWVEINSKVGDVSNNSNDEMMMIDAILDEILPCGVVKDGIGYEPFK